MSTRLTRNCVLMMGIVGLSLQVASAAPPRLYLSSDEPDARNLVADRKAFIREMYQIEDAQAADVDNALTELLPAQERYQRQAALTLERLRLVISIVSNDIKRTAEERGALAKKFQNQYYGIIAKAPLSLQNAIRIADAALPKDKSEGARGRMAVKLAALAGDMGMPFSVEQIDAIVVGPIKVDSPPPLAMPSRPVTPPPQTPPATPQVTIEPAQPPPSAQAQTPPVAPTPPQNLTPPPPPMPTTPSVAAPVPPLASAPPDAQWKGVVESKTAKFEFTPEQTKQAMEVLNQTAARAAAYRERNQQAYVDAEKISDAAEKEAKVKDLNRAIDLSYDQMLKRIDSIASIEQRNRAAAKDAGGK